MGWYWSWILTFTGVTTFFLAGKKIWWAWYVGLFVNQPIWLIYGILSHQWGFIASTLFYTAVYSKNAIKWTREHKEEVAASKRKISGHIPALSVNMQFDNASFLESGRKASEAIKLVGAALVPPSLPWYKRILYRLGFKFRKAPKVRMGEAGPVIGKVTEMTQTEDGLIAGMQIDTSTPEGKEAWEKIRGPVTGLSLGDADIYKQTKNLVDHKKLSKIVAYDNYGEGDGDCQSFTIFQGQHLDCEVNKHPVNFDHQHILDGMPPLRITWNNLTGKVIAEEI